MPAMWLALLGLGALPKTGLSDDAHEHQALAAVALESGALAYPGHLGVVGFYLALLLCGHAAPSSVNRYLLRTVLLLAPVVFALLACAVFSSRLFNSGAKSVLVTVMEPLPGSGYALMQLSLGLFANRRATLGWSYRGGAPLWWGIPSQPGEAALQWTFVNGLTAEVAPAPVRMHRLHVLSGHELVPFSLDVRAVRESGALALRLDNRSGAQIRAVWLIYQPRVFPLQPVAAEHTSHHRVTLAKGTALDPWPAEPLLAAPALSHEHDAPVKMALLRAVLARKRTDERSTALLVGLTEGPLTAVSTAAWSHHSTAIVVQRPPVQIRLRHPQAAD